MDDQLASRLRDENDLSSEEEKIVHSLNHVSVGASSFLKDAFLLMKRRPPLDTSTHLVGHCLREIDSAVSNVALPYDYKPKKGNSEGYKSKIIAIVNSFQLNKVDAQELQELWFVFTELATKAHRNSLSPPRPFDSDFKEFFNKFVQLLEAILPHIISHYDNSLLVAEKLLKNEDPGDYEYFTFRNRLPNNLNTQSDFFQRLKHLNWLIKLENEGYFDKSIQDFHHPSNLSHLWPPHYFLKNMASDPRCQYLISEICLRIKTDDQALVNQLAEIVLELPIKTQVAFSKKCIGWLENVQRWYYPFKFQELLVSLFNAGKTNEALELTKALLQLLLPKEGKVVGDSDFKLPDKSESKVDIHNYEEIIEEVLKVDSASNLKLFGLFCNLLQQSIEISLTKPEERGDDDFSEIWRSAIEDHSQNYDHSSLKDVLTKAVRNLAESLLKNKTARDEVFDMLKKHHWKIFNRIAIHLIRIQLPISLNQAKKYLFDFGYWDQNVNLHELYELVGVAFPLLKPEEQKLILDWIDKGITDDEASRFLKNRKLEATSQNIEKAIKSWKRKRYYPIRKSLPKKLSELVENLDKELGGPIEYPGFRSYSHGGSYGPRSFLTIEQLNEMTGDKVFEFLLNWVPDHEDALISPSPEGLGRNLVTSIETTGFEKYSALISKFIKLNPTYVRSFISGFAKTIDKRTDQEWKEILKLAEKIITDPPEFKVIGKRPFETDSDWAWTYSEIIELINSGFRSEKNTPSLKLREQFWGIISGLVSYPDAQKDENDKREDIDYIGIAINSVAGKAFEAVIRYGHWVISANEKKRNRIELIPEVAGILEKHLDSNTEQRLAIHSLYGEWLDWLIWYDKQWFEVIEDKIFPSNDVKKFNIAWSTYVSYRGPRKTTLKLIEGAYLRAILQLEETSDTDNSAVDHLVQHLMLFYWYGDLGLESSLIQRFFEKANSRLKMRALEVIGRFLCDDQSYFTNKTKERLLKLWKLRKSVSDPIELEGFGGWFVSHRFSDGWRVNELVSALEISKRAEPDHKVMDELAELVVSYPTQVLKAASLMVDGAKEYWEISSWGRELTIALDTIKDSKNENIVKLKKELVSKLCANGHNSYRKYLIGN